MQWLNSFFDKSFLQNVVASFAYVVLVYLFDLARSTVARRLFSYDITATRSYILLVIGTWIAGTVYVASHFANAGLFFLLSGATATWMMWRELAQFWNVGLIRADRSIASGLSYEEALNLCQNEMHFLGLGASKLTSLKGFEEAVRRCHKPGMPIRFLLSKPDNGVLGEAASRHGKDPVSYKSNVESSLRVLAELSQTKKLNIEVRFYPSGHDYLPLFRLMFVNRSICLVSYYVFGEGDGSQLPQLIVRRLEDKRDAESFYFAFEMYFTKLWAESEPWDFTFPVKGPQRSERTQAGLNG